MPGQAVVTTEVNWSELIGLMIGVMMITAAVAVAAKMLLKS